MQFLPDTGSVIGISVAVVREWLKSPETTAIADEICLQTVVFQVDVWKNLVHWLTPAQLTSAFCQNNGKKWRFGK